MTDFTAQAAHEVNTTTAGDQMGPVVSPLSGGGHVVAWTSGDGGGLFAMAQLFDAGGAKSGPELTLAPGYSAGGIAALADGTFVVSLTQNFTGPDNYPRSAVYYARFDSSGHALGAPVLVDGSGNYDIAVHAGSVFALPGGGFAIDDTSISRPVPVSDITHSLRVFDAAGTPVQAIDAGENYVEQIDALANGGFVFADDPYTGPGPSRPSWHVVDAQGNATAGAELRSVYGQSNYNSTAVVALANGGAVAVWNATQYTGDQATAHWQAQLIDASGHAAGAPVDWNYSGGGERLTALANGGFLATWATQSANGGPYELYGQAYDASAHASGGVEHLATIGTASSAYGSSYSLTATPDGGFLLDYQMTSDGQDLFEQKFDAVPASSGGSVPVITGDSMSLAGAHTQYNVSSGSISGPEGTVSLAGIERVHFADGFGLALDVQGDAGEAYRLYQAAFDRAPDLPGLGYHINDLDRGVPLWLVAQHFIDSPEFQTTYGATDDTQFITLLYENVLHRGPDQGGLQFHLDEFAHGESRSDMLIHFSESPENQANVIGQIGNGMLYVALG